ncbi:MAG: putative zinc-binding protein [Deltaproteobacteria bacterium]|nr:putative zinc-binding protein [Deltaproteobacteria bacterium]
MNTQNSQAQCSCSSAPKLIFPCSGASDVGGLTDRAARQMTVDQTGKMFCLAGIGGRVEGIMANTKAAARVLVIDGCKEECARKTMELAAFKDFQHLRLTDMGFEKGKTRVTAARIREVATKGAELLACCRP